MFTTSDKKNCFSINGDEISSSIMFINAIGNNELSILKLITKREELKI